MPIRERVGSGLLVATGLALLLPFTGCSGDDTPAYPVIEVTPVTSVHSVYASGKRQNFLSGDYMAFPIQLSVAGRLDITVDWTFSSSWIYVYFGNTLCSYDDLAKHTCPFLISSETRTPKPRVLYSDRLPVGQYYLVLYNVPWDARTKTGTDNTETVVFEIGLTVTADSGARLPVQLGQPIVFRQPGR
jgi:hypothetical protein